MQQPREIRRLEGKGLQITWSNGHVQSLQSEVLRKLCPCAGCREKRGDLSHDKPLSPAPKKSMLTVIDSSIEQELNLKSVWQVGQYAIGLEWGDGHNTGIYTFDYLAGIEAPL